MKTHAIPDLDSGSPASWAARLDGFLQALGGFADGAGVPQDDFFDELGLSESPEFFTLIQAEAAIDVAGVNAKTLGELQWFAREVGRSTLQYGYDRLRFLPPAAWPLDAFDGESPVAAELLQAPSLGPHRVLEHVFSGDHVADSTKLSPWHDGSVNAWLRLRSDEVVDAQWLILSDECGETAVVAALHLATDDHPLPVFICDWMDEIGLIRLGSTARRALEVLVNRAIDDTLSAAADFIDVSSRELRGLACARYSE